MKSSLPICEISAWMGDILARGETALVGVDGGAGSGKTTFTAWLAAHLREQLRVPVDVVPTDRIFRPVNERWAGTLDDMPIGYDLDWERVRDEVILPLRAGHRACFQLYDWVTDAMGQWVEIGAGGVTIIEGVCALRNELAKYYGLRVWFSCPPRVRATRLLRRGDTSQAELDYWLPIEERYHAVHRPEESAHLVVDSSATIGSGREMHWLKVLRWSPPEVARQAAAGDLPEADA